MKPYLEAALAGKSLSRLEARALIQALMVYLDDENAPREPVSALLVALRLKQETALELSGFLDGFSVHAVKFDQSVALAFPELMDVCGTGGDGLRTFNVSTAVALVLASLGVTIAKHGNRGVLSSSGSSDVLEALGLKSQLTPAEAIQSLQNFRAAFIHAPAFHPALAKISKLRKNLGVSTFFNALGPVLNPAPISFQLMGVYQSSLIEKIAEVFRLKGLKNAWVVHGEDGLDEFTLNGATRIAQIKSGMISLETLAPEDFGLTRSSLNAAVVRDSTESAMAIRNVFAGEHSVRRDLVLINTAAALMVAGKSSTPRDAVAMASGAIDSGATLHLLNLMQKSQRRYA